MIFQQLSLPGAYLISLQPIEDERGFFARTFCETTFAERRLKTHFPQCSLSSNRKKGTLRGLHYQISPHEEAKLIRCLHGSVYDVIVDVRPSSPTFGRWEGVVLTPASLLYVPEGFAHGFQTLEDHTELFYQISQPFVASSARGIRWNDPILQIPWPLTPSVISEKDQRYPDFVKFY